MPFPVLAFALLAGYAAVALGVLVLSGWEVANAEGRISHKALRLAVVALLWPLAALAVLYWARRPALAAGG